jgi:phosphoglycerate kinase
MDLDVAEGDDSRLIKSVPTIKLLLENNCKIVIIGHKGRPEGKDETLSLRPVYVELMTLIEPVENVFIEDVSDKEKIDQALATNQIVFLENLRYWKGEESNDPEFLKGLVEICNFYVDDAFAVAHRKHRSIMLYKDLPGFYGNSFIEEAEKIQKALNNPERPLTIILGGAKEDKLKYLSELEKVADHVLVGGKLPKLVGVNNSIVAKLRQDGLDLSDEDINKFKEIISSSKTIIWAGAMGLFENENAKKGTREIAKAVAEANAYKIIAGGDTGASIVELGLKDKIDFVCSGGGVMLEYVAQGKLPSWE